MKNKNYDCDCTYFLALGTKGWMGNSFSSFAIKIYLWNLRAKAYSDCHH